VRVDLGDQEREGENNATCNHKDQRESKEASPTIEFDRHVIVRGMEVSLSREQVPLVGLVKSNIEDDQEDGSCNKQSHRQGEKSVQLEDCKSTSEQVKPDTGAARCFFGLAIVMV
jgi:hypothetical protein